jgi:methionine--tRNA ligase beta chain
VAKVVEAVVPDIAQMDIRVGKITKVWKHPDSEKLYCEEVDIGNGEIRKIASGLQAYVTLERMTDSLVVVLCNLKPKKLAGYESHGMVLCGETADKSVVELIEPPIGSQPGDLISFEGQDRNPPAVLNVKKNPWDNVSVELKINEQGQCCWKDGPFKTPRGVCTVPTLKAGVIH